MTSDTPRLTISQVSTLEENDVALRVCRRVWGATAAQDHELYWVIATHGGYLAVAHLDGLPVGVSLGVLAHQGTELVSHFTGVAPGFANAGVGFALKQHQRAWAATQNIETITWTFDPLVRRNAWFNLVRLGATIRKYTVNYYGPLNDAINGEDETDRFEVAWHVVHPDGFCPSPLRWAEGDRLIDIPLDIEALRANDPELAKQWRIDLRSALVQSLHDDAVVAGMTEDYRYVVRPAPNIGQWG